MSAIDVKLEGSGVEASGEESAGEMTWKKPTFDTSETKQQNPRLVKKKRTHYNSVSHVGINGLTLADPSAGQRFAVGNRAPYGKNSRKSRNGFRQMPKKTSGKDVWMRVSDEVDELELDEADPDYESDEQDPTVIESVETVLNDDAFEKYFYSLIREYYDHLKPEEVIAGLREITMNGLQRRRLPFLAIIMALQHKLGNCELTSELLSEMCGKVLSMSAMQQGFQLILDDMPDIVLDVPKAPDYVGRFIARAIADDILPPKFVQQYKEMAAAIPPAGTPPVSSDTAHPPVRIAAARRNSAGVAGSANTHSSSGVSSTSEGTARFASGDGVANISYAMQAINKAEELLTLSHAYRHLDIVWGIPPSERVTTLLMKQIACILDDYVRSDNLEGAISALQELDSPHFYHELVYQAFLLVFDHEGDERVNERLLRLLDKLCRSVVISLDQLVTGVKRVYSELPELQKERPVVYVLLERFLKAAVATGFVSQKLADEMPSKSRRRFVSEGDSMRRAAPVKRLL